MYMLAGVRGVRYILKQLHGMQKPESRLWHVVNFGSLVQEKVRNLLAVIGTI